MSKLNCPHCGKQGISILRKWFLGPAKPATCKLCGKKIGVPYTSLLAFLPFIAAIVGSRIVDSVAVGAAILAGGAILASCIIILCVPLIPR